jgi:quinol monooxygenase YgiN
MDKAAIRRKIKRTHNLMQKIDQIQATIAVFGILRFPPERMNEVLPHLRILVETTYKSDNCIAYDIAVDPFDPGLIRFSELWPNHESLTLHLQAPHIDPWRSVARNCGLIERKFTAYDIAGSREV